MTIARHVVRPQLAFRYAAPRFHGTSIADEKARAFIATTKRLTLTKQALEVARSNVVSRLLTSHSLF
jgi:hypothetical protein